MAPIRAGAEDVDLDGDLDLILHFSILEMVKAGAINDQTTSLCLGAFTLDNLEAFGSDEVTIVPAGKPKKSQPAKSGGNSNSHGGKSNKGGKNKKKH